MFTFIEVMERACAAASLMTFDFCCVVCMIFTLKRGPVMHLCSVDPYHRFQRAADADGLQVYPESVDSFRPTNSSR